MNRRHLGDDVFVPTSSSRNSRLVASSGGAPVPQPVVVVRSSSKSLAASDATSVASANTNNSSSAAAGTTKKRGGKNRNRPKKLPGQSGNNNNNNSNTKDTSVVGSSTVPPAVTSGKTNSNNSNKPKNKKNKKNKKWPQNNKEGDGITQNRASSNSFHLPQVKVELRNIVMGHLKRYEKEISFLKQQQQQQQPNLSNKEGEVALEATPADTSATSTDVVTSEKTTDARGAGATTGNEDPLMRWLSSEQKMKRQMACTNAHCMMLLIRDLVSGLSCMENNAPSPSPNSEGGSFFWSSSNILFQLDHVSVQNMLWEWTYPPTTVPPTPWGFDENKVANTTAVDKLGDKFSKITLMGGDSHKMDKAYVHVRVMYVQPPRKSRRRGEVSGIAYFILTPELNSIKSELKRQSLLRQLKPSVTKQTVTVKADKDSSNKLPAEVPNVPDNGNDGAVLIASSEVQVEPVHVDNAKVTAFSRLILNSAVKKLQSYCSALSPVLRLSISHNQKSFPEPKYQQPVLLESSKRRRLRGENRLENTLEKSEDYIEFLKLYEANEGRIPMVLADEQAAGQQRIVTAVASNTGAEPPVAALVAHLQMKRKEEEEKKALAKQRKAQLSKKSSNVSASKTAKGKGSTQAVSSAQVPKSSKPTATKSSKTGGTKVSSSSQGGANKSRKKSSGGNGGMMNAASITAIIKPRTGSS